MVQIHGAIFTLSGITFDKEKTCKEANNTGSPDFPSSQPRMTKMVAGHVTCHDPEYLCAWGEEDNTWEIVANSLEFKVSL